MTEKLLLVDGHSIAFRAYFALAKVPGFVTDTGQRTNGVYGFVDTLIKQFRQEEPTHVAVAFDLPGDTFRTREYPAYKGGRAETPEDFKPQVPLIQSVLDALGITWLTKEDIEADDIIATLATQAEAAGMDVAIVSGDKDSYQLVNDHVTVLYPMPRSAMLRMTPEMVVERTGVRPDQYADLAALVGEGADNIPGVPKVGNKTAAKWLAQYGNLESILENADDIGGKVGESLRDHVDMVRRNRKINHLLRDADLDLKLSDLVPRGYERQSVHRIFDLLEFNTIKDRAFETFPAHDADDDHPVLASSTTLQDSAVADDGDLAAWLSAHRADHVGLYVEGEGRPREGQVSQFALAARSGEAIVGAPHSLGEGDDAALVEWLADAEAPKVLHGAKWAWHAWHGQGMTLNGVVGDTELSAYLLHPDQRKYDVEDLSLRYRQVELPALKSTQQLDLGLGGEANTEAPAARALAILELDGILRADLASRDEEDLLTGIELPVSEVLQDLEQIGIAIDRSVLETLESDFDSRVQAAQQRAFDAIGHEVNLSSPKQLQVVLFDELALPPTRKTKSGFTTNAEALTDLFVQLADREDDNSVAGREFLGQLMEHRDAIKLRQSVEGLVKSIADDGRIHTTFQQTVAATGRLSSTEPNLQNIHTRTEEGRRIRSAFVPGDGFESLMTADYSQIEMRLMAHLSEDENLIEAFQAGEDLHNYVGGQVFGVKPSEVTGEQRSKIKAMSYGLAYGLSAFGLSRQLRIEVGEAKALMDNYFDRFGGVRDYLRGVVDQARADGYTETIHGRRRYLPDLKSSNRQVRDAAERMALNAPIQGSAADIIKIAMIDVEAALRDADLTSRMLLQVHDELVLEIAPGEEETVRAIVESAMAGAASLSVPLSVGIGVGENWLAAAH